MTTTPPHHPGHSTTRTTHRLGTLLALLATTLLITPAQPAWAETIQDQQWYLDTLSVDQAHQISQGAGILVAVVDTGIGTRRPHRPGPRRRILLHPEEPDSPRQGRPRHGHGRPHRRHRTDHNDYLGIAPQAQIVSVRIAAERRPEGTPEPSPRASAGPPTTARR